MSYYTRYRKISDPTYTPALEDLEDSDSLYQIGLEGEQIIQRIKTLTQLRCNAQTTMESLEAYKEQLTQQYQLKGSFTSLENALIKETLTQTIRRWNTDLNGIKEYQLASLESVEEFNAYSFEGLLDIVDDIRSGFAAVGKALDKAVFKLDRWLHKLTNVLTGKYKEAYNYLSNVDENDFKAKAEKVLKRSEKFRQHVGGSGVRDYLDAEELLLTTFNYGSRKTADWLASTFIPAMSNDKAEGIRERWTQEMAKEFGNPVVGNVRFSIVYDGGELKLARETIKADNDIDIKYLKHICNQGLFDRFKQYLDVPGSRFIQWIFEASKKLTNWTKEYTNLFNGSHIQNLVGELHGAMLEFWKYMVDNTQVVIDFVLAVKAEA